MWLAMDLYAENILDHYRSPRHKTPISPATIKHEEINLSCGDAITLSLQINDGKITALGWNGTGCAISQAAMSMLSEELTGTSIDDAEQLSTKDVQELLGVPVGPRRTKCAMLCLHTLKNAIKKSRGGQAQGWAETVAA
jgi:nitrogen fixation NifU-like protein